MVFEKSDIAPPIKMEPNHASKDPKPWQKYACAALAVVLVIAIIIAGFITAFYFMHKTSRAVIQSKDLSFNDDGKTVHETMREYNDDVYKYDVRNSRGSFSVVEDYSRRTILMRTDEPGFQQCFILPMGEEHTKPGFELDVIGNDNTTEKVGYELVKQLIENHDVLSDVGMEMCEGYPLYWAHTTNNKGRRAKRDTIHCTGCKCYDCGCGVIRCICEECHHH